MQKFILSIVLTIFSLTVMKAQSKFSVGLGASANVFIQSTPDPYFNSHNYILPHLHFKYEPFTYNRFSGQVQANFYSKRIGLSTTYESNQGGTIVEGFYYQHLATDLVLSVAYKQPISKHLSFQPRLGYFFSYNHFFDATQQTGVSGGGSTASNFGIVNFSEATSYFHPGVMAGFSVDKLKNRSISLFADVYLTPRDIFSAPLTYQIDGQQPQELQGKFHYLNVGIRYELDKF